MNRPGQGLEISGAGASGATQPTTAAAAAAQLSVPTQGSSHDVVSGRSPPACGGTPHSWAGWLRVGETGGGERRARPARCMVRRTLIGHEGGQKRGWLASTAAACDRRANNARAAAAAMGRGEKTLTRVRAPQPTPLSLPCLLRPWSDGEMGARPCHRITSGGSYSAPSPPLPPDPASPLAPPLQVDTGRVGEGQKGVCESAAPPEG